MLQNKDIQSCKSINNARIWSVPLSGCGAARARTDSAGGTRTNGLAVEIHVGVYVARNTFLNM